LFVFRESFFDGGSGSVVGLAELGVGGGTGGVGGAGQLVGGADGNASSFVDGEEHSY